MPGLKFDVVEETARVRDGRQWMKDVEFCDSIVDALKGSYNDSVALMTKVTGKTELRKLRGALRHFANVNGWGLSLKTVGDETDAATDATVYTVRFKAQDKREAPESTGPRKVRRRKDETDEDYTARVTDANPKLKGEKAADYAARLAILTGTAEAA